MIDFINIKGWNHEKWLDFRTKGVGGSECGEVFNESKWGDSLKLYLNKIGEPISTFYGNRHTEFGKFDEPQIADLYQYWDEQSDDPIMQMFKNRENKVKINTVRSEFAYVVNPKFPWLFASIDRRILRNKHLKRGRGVLECKNTTSMEKNTYKYGINPAHVLQVYQYLMILEWEYADVAIKYDGNNFDVVTFEPNKEMFESIEYTTAKFWSNVEKARRIKLDYKIDSYYGMPDYYFSEQQLEGVAMLQALEPEITPVTYKWIKELVHPTPEYSEMIGTDKLLSLASEYNKYKDIKVEAESNVNKYKASIIAELKGTHVANYETGRISYKPDKNGKCSVRVNFK